MMYLSRRLLSTVKEHHVNSPCQEIRIPVPWGHIAGKWWGPQDKRPILAIHGWQDNCGSFDRLIPLLPRHVGYLAIDMPGHGHSSRLPPGAFYGGINGIITIKLIREFFKWKTVSFLTHSNGAMTSYSYGFIHPDTVDFLIAMDPMQMDRNPLNAAIIRKSMDDFIKYEQQNLREGEPPSYSLEDMALKLHTGSDGSIDLDKCQYILKRNVIPAKNKPGLYHFNIDPRLKCFDLINWGGEVHREAAKLITFPVMITLIHHKVDYIGFKANSFVDLLNASKFFESHRLGGKHHAHLNDPEMFVGLITEFMAKHDKDERSMMFDMSQIRV